VTTASAGSFKHDVGPRIAMKRVGSRVSRAIVTTYLVY